jgi:hypothetical protein
LQQLEFEQLDLKREIQRVEMRRLKGGFAACLALALWMFAANIVVKLERAESNAQDAYYSSLEASDKAERAIDRTDDICRRLYC